MNTAQLFTITRLQANMDLKAEASRFYLSYLWWLLEPILFVLVFYVVFEVLLQTGGENYLLFLMCGKIPFLWFSKSVNNAANSIVQNKGLIAQVDIPKAIFPNVSVYASAKKEMPVFVLLLLLVTGFGYAPSLDWIKIAPLIVAQYLLILGCAMYAALIVSFVLDFRLLISMGTLFLLFASGVFWDISRIPDPTLRELLLQINPIAFLLDGYRKVLMHGESYDGVHLALIVAFSLLAILMAAISLRVFSKRIAGAALRT